MNLMKKRYDFEELFNLYKNRIYRLGLSVSRNEKDAEDILQNTFLKIIQHIEAFKNKAHLSTWIYKIAYNEALMLLRKKRRHLSLEDSIDYQAKAIPSGLLVNWAAFPDQRLLEEEMKARIDRAIKHMPIKYRMPLLLQRVEGQSLKSTAEILGLKENSLKTRLHRANMFVKAEMAQYFEGKKQSEEEHHDERCRVITDFIYDYAEGTLKKGKKIAFEKHINDCEPCKIFLNAYQRAICFTKALYCRDLPEELQAKIESFIMEKKKISI
ncbi:MAG: sigma-70 family RNA polymerase sigma factor [Candidatus Omnitrophica bacterium]|nr:sigma-70 family RNA polymerase sigma factor [Candidatus Omnitrophota bacterium]